MLPDQNSKSNTKKKRILVVDDEPDITLNVKAGLEATGIDIGWGSSASSICICSLVDSRIIVYWAEEYEQAVPEDFISLVLELQQKYNVSHTFIDASAPGFIRSLLLSMHQDPDYNSTIKRAHAANIDPGLWLKVIPIPFGTTHKQMLQNVKFLLSDDLVAISPFHDKLIQSLYSAVDTEDSIKREQFITMC